MLTVGTIIPLVNTIHNLRKTKPRIENFRTKCQVFRYVVANRDPIFTGRITVRVEVRIMDATLPTETDRTGMMYNTACCLSNISKALYRRQIWLSFWKCTSRILIAGQDQNTIQAPAIYLSLFCWASKRWEKWKQWYCGAYQLFVIVLLTRIC